MTAACDPVGWGDLPTLLGIVAVCLAFAGAGIVLIVWATYRWWH